MDLQPVLAGQTLRLEPLEEAHRPGLTEAASDPDIWAQHPSKERYKPQVFNPYFDFLLESGGTLAIVQKQNGRIIGCSRFYAVPEQPDGIGIGFTFLARDFWGGKTNRELKTLMIEHAFKSRDEIWFHIAPDNIRSQKATGKIGARFRYEATLDISGGPALTKCYSLSKAEWENAARGGRNSA